MRLIRLLKRDLAREMATWVGRDLLSTEQARQICQLYGIDFDSVGDGKRGYAVLMGLGFLFVGLALITLIGANWEDIPRAVRAGGLVTVTTLTHLFALHRLGRDERGFAVALFLLGNLLFGASIILIAQVYHLGEHMPDGVFWWALGSLPFALILRESWLTLFSLALAFIWFFLELNLGFFPTLFPMFILAGIYVLVTGPTSILLFVTIAGACGIWYEAALSALWTDAYDYKLHAEHLPASAALFIFAYALSHVFHASDSAKIKDFDTVLTLWVLRFTFVALLLLSFEYPWREAIRESYQYRDSMLAVTAAMLLAAALVAWRVGQLAMVLGLSALCLGTTFALIAVEDASHAIAFQTATNLVLVSLGIRLIWRGIVAGLSHYYFLGVSSILVTGLVRYFDLIGDYVGGAALFMVMALVLLAAARFWRQTQTRDAR
ncbi:MAG: DUF2157 domain-containing protein [Chromatiales bacterium]|jgi:uncharacterized membrane protein|nr:DUF2157 domain-containing protein [Chromatiales bacterium]